MFDVRNFRGAECGTEYYVVDAKYLQRLLANEKLRSLV